MRNGVLRCFIGIAGMSGLLLCVLELRTQAAGPSGSAADLSSPISLTQLKKKFDGANTCASEKCHGAAKPAANGQMWANEYTLWHGTKDPHHKAFRTLVTQPAKDIAAKLKIPLAIKSDRCLNCHTTFATGPGGIDLKGKEYSPADGVSCASCHGPSQDWLDKHATKGWTDEQRKAAHNDPATLLTNTGLLDTKPPFERAARCTSCHLAIEADLVAAGHPQPTFEMNYFSSLYGEKYDRHWHDPEGAFAATLWANGQVVEVHSAMSQLAQNAALTTPNAADLTAQASAQAMAHYQVFSTLFASGAITGDSAKLEADVKKVSAAVTAKDMAAIKSSATAAAEDALALKDAVAKFDKPAAPVLQKLLSAVAALDIGKAYGPRGEEQQAYALLAFAQASGNKPLEAALKPLLPTKPGEPPKPADFAKALADVQGKLPK